MKKITAQAIYALFVTVPLVLLCGHAYLIHKGKTLDLACKAFVVSSLSSMSQRWTLESVKAMGIHAYIYAQLKFKLTISS